MTAIMIISLPLTSVRVTKGPFLSHSLLRHHTVMSSFLFICIRRPPRPHSNKQVPPHSQQGSWDGLGHAPIITTE